MTLVDGLAKRQKRSIAIIDNLLATEQSTAAAGYTAR